MLINLWPVCMQTMAMGSLLFFRDENVCMSLKTSRKEGTNEESKEVDRIKTGRKIKSLAQSFTMPIRPTTFRNQTRAVTVKSLHNGYLVDKGKWTLKRDGCYRKERVEYDTSFFLGFNIFILSLLSAAS